MVGYLYGQNSWKVCGQDAIRMLWLKHNFPVLAHFIQLVKPGLVSVVAKYGKYALAK